jgi:hypothetical protein
MLAHEHVPFFSDIGARLVVHGVEPGWPGRRPARVYGDADERKRLRGRPYELDTAVDDVGEHFRMRFNEDAPDFQILQTKRDERHLLLLAAEPGVRESKERLLCGHDERHWFISAIGEPVSTVEAARRALLPPLLRHKGLNKSTLKSRANEVFKRQGEWFFVPVKDELLLAVISREPVHPDEPIQRGARSKPHRVQALVRFGGTAVVLNGGREYSEREWEDKLRADPDFQRRAGRVERRTKDMKVYVRGKIRHPDHATIELHGWHEVMMNGEIFSTSVTFYD